ncbi:hypothetical protein [Hespellia stercorisuis]|uniref:Uncharacterized protein n=1 Tax=Hespellia stercorisuis DSM 15480 TaxID=1121950 RepID=A0A1M6TXX2_9FIRM|nr:hypothetical protein [Hespellia stercorisuis]SHK61734.1 hypothetical protein SAMN02745243_03351 [Hespellia stercorisuis DSM 15480]
MLNEDRVRLMTQMAANEGELEEEDLKISSYYRKDYSSLHTLITVLWLTVGYGIIVGLVALGNMDAIMKNLTINKTITLCVGVVVVYVVLVIIYAIAANQFYKAKHNKAKQRVKKYYRDLSRLGKLYMKEK